MKKLLSLIITMLVLYVAGAQNIDSVYMKAMDSTVTVTLPVKAVKHYAAVVKTLLTGDEVWKERGAPTYLKTRVPNAQTPNDSLVTVTVRGKVLADWLDNVQAERIGEGLDFYRSVIFNLPAIPGYTPLANQLITIRNGAGAQKNVAGYVVARFQNYQSALEANFNSRLNSGSDFIWNY